jgi:hypothetical protein
MVDDEGHLTIATPIRCAFHFHVPNEIVELSQAMEVSNVTEGLIQCN